MPAASSAAAARRSAPDTIQCFKPGRHVALSGHALAFVAADLAATARAYDPALHEAPLVVGHPETDGPAYGWVGALAYREGSLEAAPRQVNAQFAQLVNDGAYKKVSCAFWAPDAPGNPVPGVYYLRHIGFLGAAAPAVEGLRTPQFAGGDVGVVEFAAWDDVDNASLWRGLRDWLLGKFGQAEADVAIPPYLVASVERGAQADVAEEAAIATAQAAFAAPATERTVTPQEKAALEADNARLRQQLADQAAAAAQARNAAAHTDAVAFADGLVASGRLADGKRQVVVELVERIARGEGDTGAVIHFAAADNAQEPLLPAVKELLGQLPLIAPLGRVATVAFAAGSSAGLDIQDAGAVARAATEYVDAEGKAGRTVSTAAAVEHVIRQASAGRA